MANDAMIKVTIAPTWSVVEDIRKKVREKLSHVDPAVVEKAVMTASELVENAVKYGASTDAAPLVDFMFEYSETNKLITIQVANGVLDISSIDLVRKTIDKINKTEDKAGLYTARLMELMENPQPGVSQLGLYRIAYEGEYTLEYKENDGMLTIIAKQKL